MHCPAAPGPRALARRLAFCAASPRSSTGCAFTSTRGEGRLVRSRRTRGPGSMPPPPARARAEATSPPSPGQSTKMRPRPCSAMAAVGWSCCLMAPRMSPSKPNASATDSCRTCFCCAKRPASSLFSSWSCAAARGLGMAARRPPLARTPAAARLQFRPDPRHGPVTCSTSSIWTALPRAWHGISACPDMLEKTSLAATSPVLAPKCKFRSCGSTFCLMSSVESEP
mmetsp:Transcript_102829/g.331775  ORF Transcript_102829/g.331775 Transcript_102829/m.331775 type:complete len:226 (-) Transcript_102829:1002-1679(-)